MLGTSLQGASAAFVLTTGRTLAEAKGERGPGAGSTAAASSSDTRQQLDAAGAPPAAAADQATASAGTSEQQATNGAAAKAAAGAAAKLAPAPAPAAAERSAEVGGWELARLRLWNPLTGLCVPVTDAACELREVGGAA